MKKKRLRTQKLSPAEQQSLTQAQQLLDAGRLGEAVRCCEQLTLSKPRALEPWRLLSWIHMRSSDFFPAQAAAEQAAALHPGNAITIAWTAEVCSEAGDLRAAQRYREQVRRLESKEPAVQASMAASLTAEQNHGQALAYYRKLWKQNPRDIQAQLNVAYSARYAGDFELAEERLRELIARQPRFHQAYFALSQLGTVTADNNHLDILESALKTCGDDAEAGSFLGYALGKEYEDLGEYSRAFTHYERAARCQRQLFPQPSREAEMAGRLRELFGNESQPSADSRGEGLIFVVGLPRTGTTLLDRMLGAHSQVHNAGELRAFPFMAHRQLGLRVGDNISPALLDRIGELDYTALGESYLSCLPSAWLANGDYLTDKNPANYLYAGMIARALPGARVVHIRRAAMDACFSNYKQLFAPGAYRYSYSFSDLARHYAAYDSLARIWRDSLGDRYIELSYEDLVADTEHQLHRVFSASGLAWESGVLDFHQRSTGVGTASFAQVRKPVYGSSVERWRKFETQLQPLALALKHEDISPDR